MDEKEEDETHNNDICDSSMILHPSIKLIAIGKTLVTGQIVTLTWPADLRLDHCLFPDTEMCKPKEI